MNNEIIIIGVFIFLCCIVITIPIVGRKILKSKITNLTIKNESIKNYENPIVINENEYRKPSHAIMKNGEETIEQGMFLEINKSNELYKKGKHANGIIVDIIDKREFDIVIDEFDGDVFLIVEFFNNIGKKYTIKTPAISQKMYNYVRIGQTVDVYYDDSVINEPICDFVYETKEKKYYDNIAFYVTNIKAKKVSRTSLLWTIFAVAFFIVVIGIIFYSIFYQ